MDRRNAFIALCAIFFFTFCNDYNPFQDINNAGVVLLGTSTITQNDTVRIYTTYNLDLTVTAHELIDSFSVRIESDRFHLHDTVVRAIENIEYRIPVSFYDTGGKHITILTYKKKAQSPVPYDIRVQVTSPLHQNDINTSLGGDILFSTPAVGDSVWYHWTYGYNLSDTVHSTVCKVNPQIRSPGFYTGALWVSEDSLGLVFQSPKTAYSMYLKDNAGPFITCLNEGISHDTIVTADNVFVFEVHISDPGGVAKTEIDSMGFEFQSPPVYKYTFRRVTDYKTKPLPLVIFASDMAGNTTVKTYYLRYDEGGPSSSGTKIVFEGVDNDITRLQSYIIAGRVLDQSHSSLTMSVSLNDTAAVQNKTVQLKNNEGQWNFTVQLGSQKTNLVTVRASDMAGVHAELKITIIYDPAYVDTSSPEIVDVKVNGITAPPHLSTVPMYVDADSVKIGFLVLDASGLAGAPTVNWKATVCDAESLWWSAVVSSLSHAAPLEIRINAADKESNGSEYRFLVQKNKAPVPEGSWVWPAHFIAGTVYSLPFKIIDDGDRVTVGIEHAPPGLTIVPAATPGYWTLNYAPVRQDTGAYTARVYLNDTYQVTSMGWGFSVLNDSSKLVRFLTTEKELPSYAEAGSPVGMTFRIASGSGTAPFRYRIAGNRAPYNLLDTSLNNYSPVLFAWIPPAQSIGANHLTITVVDRNSSSDTILHSIEVVAANGDPCSLKVDIPSTAVYNKRGEIVMAGAREPLVIRYTVDDSDDPFTETDTLKIVRGGVTTTQILDSIGTFSITVDTVNPRLLDTIKVRVADRTGGRDSFQVRISYLPIASHPCSLALALPQDIWMDSEGAVYLADTPEQQKLRINVIDADHPMSERYVFRVIRNGTTVVDSIQDINFYFVNVQRDTSRIYDTVTVITRDLSGYSDTLVIRLLYQKVIGKYIEVNTTGFDGGAGILDEVIAFPLLVRIDSTSLDFNDFKSSRPQLMIAKPDGTPLPYEIAGWDNAAKIAEVWIKADTIRGDAVQQFIMKIYTWKTDTSSRPSSVFDIANGFRGVWHMDIASGTVPPVVNDATANKNNMVSNGMTYANQAGGLIGNALTFDGLTQYLAVPSPASLLQFTTSMTVSAWVNAAVSQINGYCDIIGRRYGTEWYDSWLLTIHSGKPCFVIGMDENLNYPYNRIYGGLIETNQWIHLAGVKNNRSYDLYVNGQLTASGISSSASLAVDANDVSIGAEQNYAYSEFFNGIIDEVEASNVDRPASWIKLSYETQKPGSRVVTVK